jgi:hypothetical protein
VIFNVYSILDSKSHVYSPPFLSRHTGEALRSFTDLVNDDRSTVSKYPGDFQLVQISTFDDELGVFMEVKPVFLGTAEQYQKPSAQLSLLAKDTK